MTLAATNDSKRANSTSFRATDRTPDEIKYDQTFSRSIAKSGAGREKWVHSVQLAVQAQRAAKALDKAVARRQKLERFRLNKYQFMGAYFALADQFSAGRCSLSVLTKGIFDNIGEPVVVEGKWFFRRLPKVHPLGDLSGKEGDAEAEKSELEKEDAERMAKRRWNQVQKGGMLLAVISCMDEDFSGYMKPAYLPELMAVEVAIDDLWEKLLFQESKSRQRRRLPARSGRGIGYGVYCRLHRRLMRSILGIASSFAVNEGVDDDGDDAPLEDDDKDDGFRSDDNDDIWEDWMVDCSRRMPGDIHLAQIARETISTNEKTAQKAAEAAARKAAELKAKNSWNVTNHVTRFTVAEDHLVPPEMNGANFSHHSARVLCLALSMAWVGNHHHGP